MSECNDCTRLSHRRLSRRTMLGASAKADAAHAAFSPAARLLATNQSG